MTPERLEYLIRVYLMHRLGWDVVQVKGEA